MKYLLKYILTTGIGIYLGILISAYFSKPENPITTSIHIEAPIKISKTDSLRTELIHQVYEYIGSRFPDSKLSAETLVEACEKYKFDICFALAQAEIESHLGTAGIASKTNSVWNVGAFDGRSSQTMEQMGLGYDHPDDSIEPYIQTIQNRYLGKTKSLEELLNNYVDLNGHRYASNPDYERLLTQKYNQISQSPIGQIQQEWVKSI